MRATYAMADHPTPEWITPGFWGAVGAAVTGGLAYLGVRLNAKKNPAVDPQDAVNDGFMGVLDQMRLELRAAKRERNDLWETIAGERAAWAAERLVWAEERLALNGQIDQMKQVALSFETLLRRSLAGETIHLPERKTYEPEQPQIVEATLRQDGLGDD